MDGGELGEILLPKRYVPKAWKTEDKLDVFVMLDSEDRLMATPEKPKAIVGEFALLRVKEVTRVADRASSAVERDGIVFQTVAAREKFPRENRNRVRSEGVEGVSRFSLLRCAPADFL